MLTSPPVALTCATPTDRVRSSECLMHSPLHAGTVLGLKILDPKGKVKATQVFHIWNDRSAQLADKRLKSHLKKLVKTLGAAHIWDHDGHDALKMIDDLLTATGMTAIDRPINSITTLLSGFDTLKTLAVHLGVAQCDRDLMYTSSLAQLRVLEIAWKQYFKVKLDDVTLMTDEGIDDWKLGLTPADKRRVTLLEKKHDHLTPVDTGIALLQQKGVCDSVLSRLLVSRDTDGI